MEGWGEKRIEEMIKMRDLAEWNESVNGMDNKGDKNGKDRIRGKVGIGRTGRQGEQCEWEGKPRIGRKRRRLEKSRERRGDRHEKGGWEGRKIREGKVGKKRKEKGRGKKRRGGSIDGGKVSSSGEEKVRKRERR